jgi:glycosyltransferase involved in cell wall biosynthesis
LPKVSIISTTYNHEKYIGKALDSIIMQKTNFDYELIIADDCSTDKTPDILREYAKKYPKIIRPILRKKNLGVVANFMSVLRSARAPYIAVCEGDDYWTDPHKLQQQVDFLEKNPDYALCFHPVRVVHEGNATDEYIYPKQDMKSRFGLEELLKQNFIQTNSVMYKRQAYDNMPEDIMPLDWYLHLYHAQFGKIGFINEVMSVYRRHPGGLWWDSTENIDAIWKKYGIAHLALYIELQKLCGDKKEYRDIIDAHISKMLDNIIKVDRKTKSQLVKKAITAFPDQVENFLMSQNNGLEKKAAQLLEKEKKIESLGQAEQHKDQLVRQKEQEIKMIKSSRFWKLRNVAARIIGKEVI